MLKKIYLILFTIILYACDNRATYIEESRYMENTIKRGDKFIITQAGKVIRNSVIVYELEFKDSPKKIKLSGRVVGLPGDTIQIKNGIVYVNNRIFYLPPTAKFHYYIALKQIDEKIKEELGIESEAYAGLRNGVYHAYLTENDSVKYHKKYNDIIVNMKKDIIQEYNYKALLNGQNKFGWDADNFGPIVVAKNNTKIDLDLAKIFLNKINENDITGNTYSVENDHYFIITDNFHSGGDSRDIGLISKTQIIGTLEIR
jgi:signal peptidase I